MSPVLHAKKPTIHYLFVSSSSSASSDSASGNRGVALHLYGTGRLSRISRDLKQEPEQHRMETAAYKTIPMSTGVSVSSGASFPFSSRRRSSFIAQSTVAMEMNSESLAACLPVQALRPKPYVLCPSSRVSAGPGVNLPCSSRNLSGLKFIASSP